MEEMAKMGSMIDYWMRHNEYHAKSCMEWAAKAASAGNEDLSRRLVRIYLETKRLNRFCRAVKRASS